METKDYVSLAVKALTEKKGQDISVLDISKVSIMADYFIIVSGDNGRQLAALKDAVEEALGRAGLSERSAEGADSQSWILLDFNEIIIHIFSREDRTFYNLERIWKDGKRLDEKEFLE